MSVVPVTFVPIWPWFRTARQRVAARCFPPLFQGTGLPIKRPDILKIAKPKQNCETLSPWLSFRWQVFVMQWKWNRHFTYKCCTFHLQMLPSVKALPCKLNAFSKIFSCSYFSRTTITFLRPSPNSSLTLHDDDDEKHYNATPSAEEDCVSDYAVEIRSEGWLSVFNGWAAISDILQLDHSLLLRLYWTKSSTFRKPVVLLRWGAGF